MFVKKVTYTDYDGNERTEEFYFNLTKAEITEMEMQAEGGLEKTYKQIIDAQDSRKLIEAFKDLLLRSYGVKSLDGRRFIKSKELSEEFAQTEAYSIIFMELATDDGAAAEFMNGIIPTDVRAQIPQDMIPQKSGE